MAGRAHRKRDAAPQELVRDYAAHPQAGEQRVTILKRYVAESGPDSLASILAMQTYTGEVFFSGHLHRRHRPFCRDSQAIEHSSVEIVRTPNTLTHAAKEAALPYLRPAKHFVYRQLGWLRIRAATERRAPKTKKPSKRWAYFVSIVRLG